MLTIFKGLVHHLHKNRQAHPCTMIWFYPDNIERGGKGGLRNI